MQKQRWELIKALFHQASELELELREDFLRQHTAEDPMLYEQVLQMLNQDQQAGPSITQNISNSLSDLIEAQFGLKPGSQLGVYELESVIGEGGMGTVFLARRSDDEFKQKVAVKVIHSQSINSQTLQRFQTERQILADLNHPHIARLLDGGTTDRGVPYLVMEYIDGNPILDYCRQHKLDVEQRLQLFVQVCEAVKYAHQNLIVHRDIKPGNILVSEQGQVKLLDFGIAKILQPETFAHPVSETRSELRILTPENAAPEQVLGENVTTRTDVYSLGNLLYQMLTDKNLFNMDNQNRLAIEQAICEKMPDKPSIVVSQLSFESGSKHNHFGSLKTSAQLKKRLKGDLDTIILKTLQKDPERRYQSVEQLTVDISRHLKNFPIQARPDSFPYRARKFISRNRYTVALSSLLLISAFGFMAFIVMQSAQIRHQKDRALYEAETSRQITDFLIDIFQSSDPNEHAGSTLSAQDLLDNGQQKINELSDNPRLQASLLQTMGRVYQKMAEFELALPLLEKAMHIRDTNPQTTPKEKASTLADVADLHFELGLYAEAETYFRRSIDQYKTFTEEDDEELVSSISGLATVLSYQDKLEQAQQLNQQVLEIQLKKYGPLSIQAGDAYTNLGHVFRDSGKFDEADEVLTHGLEARRVSRGNMHLETAHSLNQLARNKTLMGRHDEALPLALEGLEIRRQIIGKDHPEIGASLGNLSGILFSLERYDEAEQARRESLQMMRNLFGDDHAYVSGTLNSLGHILLKKKDLVGAVDAYQQALDISRRIMPADSTRIAYPLTSLGIVFLQQQRYDDARKYLVEAYQIRKKGLPADSWHIASSAKALGETLMALNQWQSAEAYLVEAHQILLNSFGETDARTRSAMTLLNQLYTAMNKPRQALRYKPESAEENR